MTSGSRNACAVDIIRRDFPHAILRPSSRASGYGLHPKCAPILQNPVLQWRVWEICGQQLTVHMKGRHSYKIECETANLSNVQFNIIICIFGVRFVRCALNFPFYSLPNKKYIGFDNDESVSEKIFSNQIAQG